MDLETWLSCGYLPEILWGTKHNAQQCQNLGRGGDGTPDVILFEASTKYNFKAIWMLFA